MPHLALFPHTYSSSLSKDPSGQRQTLVLPQVSPAYPLFPPPFLWIVIALSAHSKILTFNDTGPHSTLHFQCICSFPQVYSKILSNGIRGSYFFRTVTLLSRLEYSKTPNTYTWIMLLWYISCTAKLVNSLYDHLLYKCISLGPMLPENRGKNLQYLNEFT